MVSRVHVHAAWNRQDEVFIQAPCSFMYKHVDKQTNKKISKTKISTMQKCEKGLITKDTSEYHLGSFILCDVNVCKERLM